MPEEQKDPIAVQIGLRIAEARNAMNLTQPALADRIGLPKWKTLSSWETGNRRAPLHWIMRISNVTGRSVASLLGPLANSSLSNEEQELVALYRATRDPTLKTMTIEVARASLRTDEGLQREQDA